MKQSTQRQDLGNNLITTQGNYLIVDSVTCLRAW